MMLRLLKAFPLFVSIVLLKCANYSFFSDLIFQVYRVTNEALTVETAA